MQCTSRINSAASCLLSGLKTSSLYDLNHLSRRHALFTDHYDTFSDCGEEHLKLTLPFPSPSANHRLSPSQSAMSEIHPEPEEASAAAAPRQIPIRTRGTIDIPTPSLPPPNSSGKMRNSHLNIDTFSPVNQNGSFEFDRVLKSGYVQKRTRKTKV